MPSFSTAPEGPGSVSGTPNLSDDSLPSDLREGYAEIGRSAAAALSGDCRTEDG